MSTCSCVCVWVISEWNFGPLHLVSESFARLAWRKAARSLISNTESLTISANMEGQSLWRASPFRFVSDALWTNSWRYCSIMVDRSDDSAVLSCQGRKRKSFVLFCSDCCHNFTVITENNKISLATFSTSLHEEHLILLTICSNVHLSD